MVHFFNLLMDGRKHLCKIYSMLCDFKSKAGPIPGDCDYSELRTAFLSHGQTCHLFIQNNQVTILNFHLDVDYNEYVPGMA